MENRVLSLLNCIECRTGYRIVIIIFGYRYKNPSVKLKFYIFDWMIIIHSILQLSFLPFNKFTSKKLGGAVGSCTYIIILWVVKGRLCLCLFIHVRTIPRWINHLFQNGRALLKCRIFILLQTNIYPNRGAGYIVYFKHMPKCNPPPPQKKKKMCGKKLLKKGWWHIYPYHLFYLLASQMLDLNRLASVR